MSDLKPCPFCGFTDVEPYRSGSDNHYVECPQCGTFGPDCESRQEAIDTWNARTEVQSAISAAVQAEREAIIQFAEYAERVAREKPGEHWEGRSCASFAIANYVRSRGPAPAVVCPECDGERWHEYENPLTGEITNRTPCATCNGAEEVPGPAPAVDALGIVREYVKSMTDLDPERGPRRYREARKALESLVLPNGEGRSCTCDHDHVEHDEHRPWCGGPHPTESVLDVVRRFLAAFDAHVASFPRGGVENAYDAIQFDKELTALRALVDGGKATPPQKEND